VVNHFSGMSPNLVKKEKSKGVLGHLTAGTPGGHANYRDLY